MPRRAAPGRAPARPAPARRSAKGSARTPVMQLRRRRCSEPSALPFQPVDRIAGRVRLRDRRCRPGAGRRVRRGTARRTGRAGRGAARRAPRPRARPARGADRAGGAIGRPRDWSADVGRQRQQLVALGRPAAAPAGGAARHWLMRLRQVDRRRSARVEGRVARGDAAHGSPRVAVAVGAGLAGRTPALASTAPRRPAPTACRGSACRRAASPGCSALMTSKPERRARRRRVRTAAMRRRSSGRARQARSAHASCHA